MKTAIITLSEQGARLAEALAAKLEDSRVYLHASVAAQPKAPRFDRILDQTRELFDRCRGLVYIAPTGLVVRAVAPCLRHKKTDPAVVVVDVGGRWSVSLLAGHEGGANDLAMLVANALSAEAVITTTTEALKTVIVGVGCRRGTPSARIVQSVREALAKANVPLEQVRLLASADLKADEPGLLEASQELGVPLKLVSSNEIRQTRRTFGRSRFVRRKVNLPAVAEPAALLAGRRTTLLLPKQKYGNVTVALAVENCMWSE